MLENASRQAQRTMREGAGAPTARAELGGASGRMNMNPTLGEWVFPWVGVIDAGGKAS